MADQSYEHGNGNGEQYQEDAQGYQEQNYAPPETQEQHQAPSQPPSLKRDDHDDDRKLFVGGLSWETTVKDMREYFTQFGEVIDCTLKTDPETGRSRGFGFITFSNSESAEKVISQDTHMLHGRNIDPKKALARGAREPIKKVFVGGLDPDVPETDIRDHFSKHGKVEEIDLPFDKIKNQRRQFCFITFDSEAAVDRACLEQRQLLGTKEVDVKKATPKSEQYGYNQRGRGGHRGGWGGGGYDGWGNQGYDYYNQPGYDYYGNYGYGGYDYSGYYNQGWGQGYNQGYGSGYGSYDYSGWYGPNQGDYSQGGDAQSQPSVTGGQSTAAAPYKAKPAAPGGAPGNYHPYQR